MDSSKESNNPSFDSFIDMDLCTDNASSSAIDPTLLSIDADQEMPSLDFSNMNQADLFKYFLDGELTPEQTAQFEAIASAAAGTSTSTASVAPADLTTLSFPQNATISPSASPLSSVEMQFEDDAMDMTAISSAKLFDSPLDALQVEPQEKPLPTIKEEESEPKGKAPQKAILPPLQVPTPSPQVLSSLPLDVQQLLAKMAEADAKPLPFGNDTSTPPQGLDDRPNSAELKKMSSKERRQLRNKISARNFRVRRKEYITTLEEQVAEQHREMQMLRMALLRIQEDNVTLRSEVETLKAKNTSTSSITSAAPAVNAPPTPASTSSTPASPSMKKLTSKDLAKPNLNKDRSISGASVGWKMGGHSPFMSVHTTLVPDISLSEKQLYEKPCLDEKPPAKTNALVQLSMASELGFSSDAMAWLAYSTMSWFATLYQGFEDEDEEHVTCGWNAEQELLREEAERKQKASLREMVW